MIIVQTCFKSLIKCLGMFVCCWVWIVGVVCEVWIKLGKNEFLVKNEHDFEFLMKGCYELMIKSVLIVLCCMLTVNKVCVTILGQLGSKFGFCAIFGCVPEREPIYGFYCSGVTRPVSGNSPWRVVQNYKRNSVQLREYRVVSEHP